MDPLYPQIRSAHPPTLHMGLSLMEVSTGPQWTDREATVSPKTGTLWAEASH
jgi:hypothetical protein